MGMESVSVLDSRGALFLYKKAEQLIIQKRWSKCKDFLSAGRYIQVIYIIVSYRYCQIN